MRHDRGGEYADHKNFNQQQTLPSKYVTKNPGAR